MDCNWRVDSAPKTYRSSLEDRHVNELVLKLSLRLAIGDRYRSSSGKNFAAAIGPQYADKHGYDLLCLDKPLDSSARAAARSPAWQKCLILSADFAKSYEQIVWVDSDILINKSCAPCIASSVPVENVGGVNLWSAPGVAEFQRALFRLNQIWRPRRAPEDEPSCDGLLYLEWGLPNGFNEIITTSFLSSLRDITRTCSNMFTIITRIAVNRPGTTRCARFRMKS